MRIIFKKRLTLVFKVIICTHLNQNEKQNGNANRNENPEPTHSICRSD